MKNYISHHNQDANLDRFYLQVKDIRIEEDTQLKKEAYETQVKASIRIGRISDYNYTRTLRQFLIHPPTEAYGIKKSLEIMQVESEGRKNSWIDRLADGTLLPYA